MRVCTVDGCGSKHEARGLCRKHYRKEFCAVSSSLYAAKRRGTHRESIAAVKRSWDTANAEHVRLQGRNQKRKDPGKNVARVRAWRDANPHRKPNPETTKAANSRRRAERLSATGRHTRTDRASLLARYRHMCGRCGSGTELEVDHIVPLKQGGTDWPGNLQVLCSACNASKRDFRIQFFLPWNGIAPRIWEECELPLLDDCDIVRE